MSSEHLLAWKPGFYVPAAWDPEITFGNFWIDWVNLLCLNIFMVCIIAWSHQFAFWKTSVFLVSGSGQWLISNWKNPVCLHYNPDMTKETMRIHSNHHQCLITGAKALSHLTVDHTVPLAASSEHLTQETWSERLQHIWEFCKCRKHFLCISESINPIIIWGIRVTSCLDFGIFNRPKRIKTPNSLFTDVRADKAFTTCWSGQSGDRVTVWVQVQAPASHLAVTP